jgi:S-methylmethionine-dependent homocysteine/selenocysteine methylase
MELPEFAAFPLLEEPAAADVLTGYYRRYVAVAAAAGAGCVLETPTWRANSDWGSRLGYDAAALDRVNRSAVELVRRSAGEGVPTRISGVVGPRGDGYIAAGHRAEEAAEYHRPQVASLASAGVDVVHAMTLSEVGEAVGVVSAARDVGVPVGVSFTVETDGRLPDGTPLRTAIESAEALAAADWYGVNCAHPTHVAPALDGGAWQERLRCLRPNASTLSHAELDVMEVLDEGDLDRLVADVCDLLARLPSVTTLGGCCGTDVRHVAAVWGVRHEQDG